MYMLDTNICIHVLKARDERLRRKFKAVGALCISSVTYGELCFGIENGIAEMRRERYRQLALFTRRLHIDSWDEDAALHYGQISATLKRAGHPIGNNDLMIAAHARSLEAILVTHNVREFSRVRDLGLEDWLSEQ